ncbi:hypothetical protein ACFVW2_43195, partial [Streptomyces sp. NPDC058171]
FDGEHLHRHRAIQVRLCAAEDHAKSTPADLLNINESSATEFGGRGRRVPLSVERITFTHRTVYSLRRLMLLCTGPDGTTSSDTTDFTSP